ncbi:hypothetical protein ACFQZC_01985 [Streptacidiphilus monticola]
MAAVVLGDVPGLLPVPVPSMEEWQQAQGTKADTGRDTGLTVEASSAALRLAPGTQADLTLRLTNGTRGEIRGELQLVSPGEPGR